MARSRRLIPAVRRQGIALALAALLYLGQIHRAAAEGHVDYRYESYAEDNGRIKVETHSALFQLTIKPRVLEAEGEIVHDAISGASPNGEPPRPGKTTVPIFPLTDDRIAGNFELDWTIGPVTLSPQVAVSQESDYDSVGVALNAALDWNQKNSTLRFGVAHSFDRVLDNSTPRVWRDKDSMDWLIGVSQLLSPKTIVTLDFTYGTSDGYLNDPYKLIRFDGYLPGVFRLGEKRPSEREREVVLLTLTQFVDPLNGSAELSYRFHHDTFGIFSHTAGVGWYQKIGKHVVLAPLFRYYQQSAADFYHASMPGFEDDPDVPQYYSADYRLSQLESFTYGVQATVTLGERLVLDAAYKRYEMAGLDGVTAPTMYPSANIFTVGARVKF